MTDSLSRTVTLLILTSKQETAKDLIRSLRNGGLAVRGIFTSDPESFEGLYATDPFELILCCEYDTAIDLDACMARYRELDLDIPLVIIADGTTESAILINALRSGARDLTEYGDTDHLQLVVARELSDLEHRRAGARLRERLEECEQRARDIVDSSGEAVAFIQEGIHVQVNPVYQKLFGFDTPEDMYGIPVLDLIAADDQSEVRESLRAVEQRRSTDPAELDVHCIGIDGTHFEAHMTASASKLEGEPCVRVTTELQEGEEKESGPANLDADTGLPNRVALMAELDSRFAEGVESKPFVTIYVGISVFPKLLQNRGLTGGLKAAAELGTSLKELAPEDTYVARVSDDGYVMLIPDRGQASAADVSAKIKRDLRCPYDRDTQKDLAPHCSTGLMLSSTITRSARDLLDTVYRDYVFGLLEPLPDTASAEPSTSAESRPGKNTPEEDRKFALRIAQAIEIDRFRLVYQPIVSLKGDSQESYDVLLRLRDDDGTLHEAKDFLPAATRSGSMVAIDRWVLRKAIEQVSEQRSGGRKVNFFVNVAEQTLREEKLLIWVCDFLREFQARGNWLTLQILEEHARRNAAVFAKLSEGLRKVQCRVALNRFGEGPNPEFLLRSLSVDYVKFPPDLGQNLADDKAQQRRLQELTKLARDGGVKSVVTGVEDARSLTVLWTGGIDYVQGNFLQRPSLSIGKTG